MTSKLPNKLANDAAKMSWNRTENRKPKNPETYDKCMVKGFCGLVGFGSGAYFKGNIKDLY